MLCRMSKDTGEQEQQGKPQKGASTRSGQVQPKGKSAKTQQQPKSENKWLRRLRGEREERV